MAPFIVETNISISTLDHEAVVCEYKLGRGGQENAQHETQQGGKERKRPCDQHRQVPQTGHMSAAAAADKYWPKLLLVSLTARITDSVKNEVCKPIDGIHHEKNPQHSKHHHQHATGQSPVEI